MLNQFKSISQNKKYFGNFFLNPFVLQRMFISSVGNFLNINKLGLPTNVNIMITSKCNVRCKMCYVTDELNKNKNTITIDDIKKLVKSFNNKHTIFFLTGGEPFIRPDIPNIIKILKSNKKHLCGAVTNGTLLNKKIINRLIKLELDAIVFSLQGDEKAHNSITGSPTSFKLLMKNLKYFADNKKHTYLLLNTTITKNNIDSLLNLIRLGESLKVDGVRLSHQIYVTKRQLKETQKEFKEKFPSDKINLVSNYNEGNIDVQKLLKIIKIIEKNKYKVDVIFHPYLSKKEIIEWYSSEFEQKRKCFFVRNAIHISSDKNLYPCQHYYYSYGNLDDGSFEELWNSKSAIKFRKVIVSKLLASCSRCVKL